MQCIGLSALKRQPTAYSSLACRQSTVGNFVSFILYVCLERSILLHLYSLNTSQVNFNMIRQTHIKKTEGTSVSETIRKPPSSKPKLHKNTKKYGEKPFSIWRMEFLHPAMWHDRDTDFARRLHLQCGMWLWNRDSEFTKWQHPAMWYVALGWHAIEFTQTSAILEFYIWFRFRPHHRAVDMSFCTSLRNFIQIGPPSAEKMTSCQFSRQRVSAILDFRDPIMGSLKSPISTY